MNKATNFTNISADFREITVNFSKVLTLFLYNV